MVNLSGSVAGVSVSVTSNGSLKSSLMIMS